MLRKNKYYIIFYIKKLKILNFLIVCILIIIAFLIGYNLGEKSTLKSTNNIQTSNIDVCLVRKNTLACNEEIKPKLAEFYKDYTGGGNAGIAVPRQIFYDCLALKMALNDEIYQYIEANSSGVTPPYLTTD